MEYAEFLEQVRLTVQEKAGGEVKVSISRLMKNNREGMDSITIRQVSGENIAPVICMDRYYETYRAGKTVDEIAEEILEFYREKKTCKSIDLSFYTDFEKARELISCKIVNYEKNRYLLDRVPHQRFLDLAIVYYCEIEHEWIGKGNILVQNAHLELWDTDLEELHDTALCNTIRLHPYELIEITDMLEELIGVPFEDEEASFPMYVLTNTQRYYGAVNLIFPPILEAIAEKLVNDFFLLPSSIHECMVVPFSEKILPEDLHRMVHEINAEHVMPDEVLGESVYRYTREEKQLVVVWDGRQSKDPS